MFPNNCNKNSGMEQKKPFSHQNVFLATPVDVETGFAQAQVCLADLQNGRKEVRRSVKLTKKNATGHLSRGLNSLAVIVRQQTHDYIHELALRIVSVVEKTLQKLFVFHKICVTARSRHAMLVRLETVRFASLGGLDKENC